MATHTLLPAATTSAPPFSVAQKMIIFQAKAQARYCPCPKLNDGVRASSHLAGSASRTCCHKDDNSIRRRDVTLGFTGALVVLTTMAMDNKSTAAARRPPPPPPPAEEKEKKDPSISDVMAKVLASKKRKEAMKQAMAKQREKGKPILAAPQ